MTQQDTDQPIHEGLWWFCVDGVRVVVVEVRRRLKASDPSFLPFYLVGALTSDTKMSYSSYSIPKETVVGTVFPTIKSDRGTRQHSGMFIHPVVIDPAIAADARLRFVRRFLWRDLPRLPAEKLGVLSRLIPGQGASANASKAWLHALHLGTEHEDELGPPFGLSARLRIASETVEAKRDPVLSDWLVRAIPILEAVGR